MNIRALAKAIDRSQTLDQAIAMRRIIGALIEELQALENLALAKMDQMGEPT